MVYGVSGAGNEPRGSQGSNGQRNANVPNNNNINKPIPIGQSRYQRVETQYDNNGYPSSVSVFMDRNNDNVPDLHQVTNFHRGDGFETASTYIDNDGDGYADQSVESVRREDGRMVSLTNTTYDDINNIPDDKKHHFKMENFLQQVPIAEGSQEPVGSTASVENVEPSTSPVQGGIDKPQDDQGYEPDPDAPSTPKVQLEKEYAPDDPNNRESKYES